MLSFVVQNFHSHALLAKTQRYNSLILSNSTGLMYTFIKLHSITSTYNSLSLREIPLNVFLYSRFFDKTFFRLFKNLYNVSMGIMSINLTKSLYSRTIGTLCNSIGSGRFHLTTTHLPDSKLKVKYLQPITVLSFAFQKRTYDTLMIFILSMLVDNYTAPHNSFKLYYSFLIKPNNFLLYPFLNLFYFKLRQF